MTKTTQQILDDLIEVLKDKGLLDSNDIKRIYE